MGMTKQNNASRSQSLDDPVLRDLWRLSLVLREIAEASEGANESDERSVPEPGGSTADSEGTDSA